MSSNEKDTSDIDKLLDTSDIAKLYEDMKKENEKKEDEFWESLSLEDRLNAFCYVTRKLSKAELDDQGSYRYVLYDVFKFYEDSYVRGMDSGYMALHNAIFSTEEEHNFLKGFAKFLGHDISDEQISDYLFKKY